MPLYRALYQSTTSPNHHRGMTYAADTAEQATKVAEDWELPHENLLTVKPVLKALKPGTQLQLIEG